MESIPRRLAKIVLVLVISLGLYWFSEEFSPAVVFEPQSTGWILWISYAKDLIQPFAFYLFLGLGGSWLQTWRVRALLAFTLPLLVELGQSLYYRVSTGHYVGTFDPIDIIMYAIGVGVAVLVDQKVFPKLIIFW